MPRLTGAHTKEKLRILSQYLPAYLQATTSALERIYVDAFAGPGLNEIKGTGELVDGSPLIALSSKAQNGTTFSQYFFIEMDHRAAQELRDVVARRFPNASVEVIRGDVNTELPKLVRGFHERAPIFVLLDTEGIEPAWETIEAIAPWRTELLITFPLGMGIKRNYSKPKVTRYFGTSDWPASWLEGDPGKVKAILDFYKDRLWSLGYKYQSDKDDRIQTEDGKDLYYIVHVAKVKPAKTIMKWVKGQPNFKGQLRLPETD